MIGAVLVVNPGLAASRPIEVSPDVAILKEVYCPLQMLVVSSCLEVLSTGGMCACSNV